MFMAVRCVLQYGFLVCGSGIDGWGTNVMLMAVGEWTAVRVWVYCS